MKKRILYFMIHIAIPLLLGGVLYCIFAPEVLFVKMVEQFVDIPHLMLDLENPVVRLARFYLFDVIWAYTFTHMIFFISERKSRRVLLGLILLEASLETLQLWSRVPGEFDPVDILVETIVTIVVYTINCGGEKSEKKSSM